MIRDSMKERGHKAIGRLVRQAKESREAFDAELAKVPESEQIPKLCELLGVNYGGVIEDEIASEKEYFPSGYHPYLEALRAAPVKERRAIIRSLHALLNANITAVTLEKMTREWQAIQCESWERQALIVRALPVFWRSDPNRMWYEYAHDPNARERFLDSATKTISRERFFQKKTEKDREKAILHHQLDQAAMVDAVADSKGNTPPRKPNPRWLLESALEVRFAEGTKVPLGDIWEVAIIRPDNPATWPSMHDLVVAFAMNRHEIKAEIAAYPKRWGTRTKTEGRYRREGETRGSVRYSPEVVGWLIRRWVTRVRKELVMARKKQTMNDEQVWLWEHKLMSFSKILERLPTLTIKQKRG